MVEKWSHHLHPSLSTFLANRPVKVRLACVEIPPRLFKCYLMECWELPINEWRLYLKTWRNWRPNWRFVETVQTLKSKTWKSEGEENENSLTLLNLEGDFTTDFCNLINTKHNTVSIKLDFYRPFTFLNLTLDRL